MTSKEYLERNALGFEGDSVLEEQVKNFIKTNKINYIIETGTYLGHTTKKLADMAKKVDSIEIDKANHTQAHLAVMDKANVDLHLGNSPIVLQQLLINNRANKKGFKKVFYLLDAHWHLACPLLEELEVISQFNNQHFICIHDFYVPDTTLEYDSYNGQRFDLAWITPMLDKIYGKDNYVCTYNNNSAVGARRGMLFVEPKEKR